MISVITYIYIIEMDTLQNGRITHMNKPMHSDQIINQVTIIRTYFFMYMPICRDAHGIKVATK